MKAQLHGEYSPLHPNPVHWNSEGGQLCVATNRAKGVADSAHEGLLEPRCCDSRAPVEESTQEDAIPQREVWPPRRAHTLDELNGRCGDGCDQLEEGRCRASSGGSDDTLQAAVRARLPRRPAIGDWDCNGLLAIRDSS